MMKKKENKVPATAAELETFFSDFEDEYGNSIPLLLQTTFACEVLERTNRSTFADELEDMQLFEGLRIAFSNWPGSVRELELIFLNVMDEYDMLSDFEDTEVIELSDCVVTEEDLRAVYQCVSEYTGSEQFRLKSMLTVRKLQRLAAGRPFPAEYDHLETEEDLRNALDTLGE